MLKKVVNALFGTRHERELKRLWPLVDQINEEWERLQGVSEEELRAQTARFRERIHQATQDVSAELEELRAAKRSAESASEREGIAQQIGDAEARFKAAIEAVLDDILPEAFATVKEACSRLVGTEVTVTGQTLTWDMVPYDVQLIGGIVLHQGKVAEMATGEGKTLVATLPLYLNALAGRGLAPGDGELVPGAARLRLDGAPVPVPGPHRGLHRPARAQHPERREAYHADITYGTNNEFGFDYLRDNMVHSLEQRVQRVHHYAIIDEVDSILIDEARTPLIISGPVSSETNAAYARYNPMVSDLYRRQTRIVAELIADAEKAIAEGDTYRAGERLLAAKRGVPRNKRLLKMFSDDPGLQKLVGKVEGDYMRDKKLHELDEQLLFAMDEKGHNAHLTDQGLDVLAPGDHDAFVIPDISEGVHRVEIDPDLSIDEKREAREELEREYAEKSEKMQVVHQLLKAYALFNKDEQYVIQDGEILIVDEFTGRMMPGRRWSDGLHQAVEAKEGVAVKAETQTLATITIQNYFRIYEKLAGMTGTAETEENEFFEIYKLGVSVIPTNRDIVRDDRQDLIYKTRREKYNAIVDETRRLHELGLPVLVGTTSVEASETLSRLFQRAGLKHSVLNAKQNEREAEIVAGAGQPGRDHDRDEHGRPRHRHQAGRGVTEPRPSRVKDLDGNEVDVVETGGLHIIGSERHESRRIDRQLRGRAGRPGRPGRVAVLPVARGRPDAAVRLGPHRVHHGPHGGRGGRGDHPRLDHRLHRQGAAARGDAELRGAQAAAGLRRRDEPAAEVIYDLRSFALEGGEELKGEVWEMIEKTVPTLVAEYAPDGAHAEDWDLVGLRNRLLMDYAVLAERLPGDAEGSHEFGSRDEMEEYLLEVARESFQAKLEQFGEATDAVLRFIVLATIDEKWKDHLYDLDHLKASIGFRGWGQKDPLVEYKKEAYDMFVDLMRDLQLSVARFYYRAQLTPAAPPPPLEPEFFGTPNRVEEDEPAAAPAPSSGGGVPNRTAGAGRRSGVGVNPFTAVPPAPRQPEGVAQPRRAARAAARRRRRGAPQRPLPLRLGEEVQELPRQERLSAFHG
jgi:preprotein translocase subunit SecA